MSKPVATIGPDLDPAARQAVLAQSLRIVASHFEGIADLAVVPSDRDAEAAVAGVGAIDLEHGVDPMAVLGYMPSAETVDPYMTGLQWSRRFAGLKVFLALATAGRAGVGAQIDRDMALGDQLRAGLSDDGWRLRNRTELPIMCFDDPDVEPVRSAAHLRAIVDAVTATGRAWLSLVTLDGRPAIRACITSYRTNETTIASLRNLLIDARASSPRPEPDRHHPHSS
jgi:hypothetical protein